jgi:hypothetical protein
MGHNVGGDSRSVNSTGADRLESMGLSAEKSKITCSNPMPCSFNDIWVCCISISLGVGVCLVHPTIPEASEVGKSLPCWIIVTDGFITNIVGPFFTLGSEQLVILEILEICGQHFLFGWCYGGSPFALAS